MNCLNFLYKLYEARRKPEPLFSHLFLAVFPSTNFFIHSLNSFVLGGKKCLRVASLLENVWKCTL